jgi:hypothetical protein
VGKPAVPELRKALVDQDAERAGRARNILADIESNDRPSVRSEWRTTSRDLMRGVTLEIYPDGRVELTVREENRKTGKKEYRTHKADSLDEFKAKFPEVAKEHDIDRFVPRAGSDSTGAGKTDDDSWEEWKKGFDREWLWDHGVGRFFKPWMPFPAAPFGRWFEDGLKPFEKLRDLGFGRERNGGATVRRQGPRFGIEIAPVSEVLASHVAIEAGKGGVLVEDVTSGSPAEKAGLKKHDILLKIDGESIGGTSRFRKTIQERMEKGFELEIVRRGKLETVSVKPEKSSE